MHIMKIINFQPLSFLIHSISQLIIMLATIFLIPSRIAEAGWSGGWSRIFLNIRIQSNIKSNEVFQVGHPLLEVKRVQSQPNFNFTIQQHHCLNRMKEFIRAAKFPYITQQIMKQNPSSSPVLCLRSIFPVLKLYLCYHYPIHLCVLLHILEFFQSVHANKVLLNVSCK